MRLALAEAAKAAILNEVPVGACVVRNGDLLAAAHNRTITDRDPSAHAEIVALRAAAAAADNHRLVGATLYVTLEPCAMCVGAMTQARIGRLVFGAYDPKAGAAGSAIDLCNDRHFNHRYEVNGGVMQGECAAQLKAFFAERRQS
ncbi:MAG: tRNA adenosine(34) deaminase TadA [Gammaproteobacteria bacterium]|nr:tRNA adenosine(34) deaminase TadA [Gammaproteobacteria bacterium]